MAGFGGNPVYGQDAYGQQAYTWNPYGYNPYPGVGYAQMPAGYNHYNGNGMYAHQTNVPGQPHNTQFAYAPGRSAAPYPVIDPDAPAHQMGNSTGGVGCEPGYNFFFHPEYCKIHVLLSGSTPPWRVPANFTMRFKPYQVATNTTLGTLMKGFGATNSTAKFNTVTECYQGGEGKWYKGKMYFGNSKADLAKEIGALGWGANRKGLPGTQPVVYLYITKG